MLPEHFHAQRRQPVAGLPQPFQQGDVQEVRKISRIPASTSLSIPPFGIIAPNKLMTIAAEPSYSVTKVDHCRTARSATQETVAADVPRASSMMANPIWKYGITVTLALHLAVPIASAQAVPDPPQNLAAANHTEGVRVVLTWETPANTGDSPITQACYRYLRFYQGGSFGETRCRSVSDLGGVNRIVTPVLEFGTTYLFNVALHNDAGRSEWAWVLFTAGVSPTLAVEPTSVAENAGAKAVKVTAALGSIATFTRDISVNVSVGGGTATAGTDYTAVDDFTVTVPSGQQKGTGSFTLRPADDDVADGDKTVKISGTVTNWVAFGGAELTIKDDDTRGLTLSRESVTVTEAAGAGHTATYTVKLSSQPTAAVTVAVKSSDAAAATVMPPSLSFTTLNWSEAQMVTVTAVDDAIDNIPDRTATISHTASGGDYASVSTDLTATITDNDGPPTAVTLAVSPASVAESAAATSIAVTAYLVGSSRTADTAVTVSRTGGTATSGTDYEAISDFTVTIAGGEASGTATLSFDPTEDNIDEDNETVVLTGTASGLTAGTATLTIHRADGRARRQPVLGAGERERASR